MVIFFTRTSSVFAVDFIQYPDEQELIKLEWLFGGAHAETLTEVAGNFIGPRKEMITPGSTNAVEISQNMGISGIMRIEEFIRTDSGEIWFDPMLQARYHNLGQQSFTVDKKPEPLLYISDIAGYNLQEGLF